MVLLLTTFCIGLLCVTFDTTRLLGVVVLAITTYAFPWLLIPLVGTLGVLWVSLRWYAFFNNTKITVKLSTYQS